MCIRDRIYDGPFSDHLFDAESVFLKNTDAVTVEEAKKKASYILDLKSDRLEYQGDINSRKNKSFYFSYKDYDIFITAMGGYCQSFSKQRDIGDIKISDEDAVKKAKDFLTKISYKNMKETYYSESGNILTVNFAYMQGDVMCYPDLIKVGVALDNGCLLYTSLCMSLRRNILNSL